jgi:hypothetical protein
MWFGRESEQRNIEQGMKNEEGREAALAHLTSTFVIRHS